MILPTRTYPAKVILFGEYTVLLGGDILAVPYPEYAAKWVMSGGEIDQPLLDYIDYLSENGIQELSQSKLAEMREFVNQGAVLDSSIKVGAGLGSSGSVVAGIYDVCKLSENSTTEALLETFVKMESYFHGNSSGIDPLVSYTQSAIHKSGGSVKLIDNLTLPTFTLYDSGISRNTQQLVAKFKERLTSEPSYASDIATIRDLNQKIINAVLAGKLDSTKLERLSGLQYDVMSDLIPPSVKTDWKSDQQHTWKICGAGGGGYFMRMESNTID
jgi:mevalonate kinase